MEKVYFEESDKSPGIILDPEERLFQFSGNSRPENVRDVYYPVIEFLEKYFKNVLTSNNQDEKIRFKFKFEYFNSSSAKFIFDILAIIKNAKVDGVNLAIDWYFMETDEDMREVGEEFSDILEVPFNYIMMKEE